MESWKVEKKESRQSNMRARDKQRSQSFIRERDKERVSGWFSGGLKGGAKRLLCGAKRSKSLRSSSSSATRVENQPGAKRKIRRV